MEHIESIDRILELIDKLKYNCHLGKHKHFSAAGRNKDFDNYFGVSIILINLFIAIVHMFSINSDLPQNLIYIISVVSIVAVLLVGLEFRYNFSKVFEAHRRIGNKYLNLARECEKFIALYSEDIIKKDELAKIIDGLNHKYREINEEAEAFPTNKEDFEYAKRIQDEKDNTP